MKNNIILFLFLVLICLSINSINAVNDNSDDTENSNNSRVLSESNSGTFTDLQNLINNASKNATLILEKDYIYTPSVDHGYIFIRNPITIIGKN